MRIELWKLFREDVRDVFECTRANMDNYMVVGTLIIASAGLLNAVFRGFSLRFSMFSINFGRFLGRFLMLR